MIHVCLYEPEIPQNTGNIMRTCVAANCHLHLIEPLGFKLDEQKVRRSGLDYRLDAFVSVYKNYEEFVSKITGTYFFITRYGQKDPNAFDFTKVEGDIYLIFGKESTGIPKDILRAHQENCIRLPMVASARSLNLSNTVAIMVYEVHRQLGYPGLSQVEVIKGKDWLDVD